MPFVSAPDERSTAASPRDVDEACGNWVWLCDMEGRRDAALDIAVRPSAMATALARHFAIVHQVAPSPDVIEFTRLRAERGDGGAPLVETAVVESLEVLPYEDASFDCITLHGTLDAAAGSVLAGWSRRRRDDAMLRECRRLLRPGGWLYVAIVNPWWHGLVRHPPELVRAARALYRAAPAFIAAADFEPVRSYYAFPTYEHPRALVPATGAALLAYDRLSGHGDSPARLRRATHRTPLHRVRAPSLVYLARARESA